MTSKVLSEEDCYCLLYGREAYDCVKHYWDMYFKSRINALSPGTRSPKTILEVIDIGKDGNIGIGG